MVDAIDAPAYIYSHQFIEDTIRRWTARAILDTFAERNGFPLALGLRENRYRPSGMSHVDNFLFEMRYPWFYRRFERRFYLIERGPQIPVCPETGEWQWTLD